VFVLDEASAEEREESSRSEKPEMSDMSEKKEELVSLSMDSEERSIESTLPSSLYPEDGFESSNTSLACASCKSLWDSWNMVTASFLSLTWFHTCRDMFSTVRGFSYFGVRTFTSIRGSLVKERDFRNCRREVEYLRLELLDRKK